MLDEGSYFHHSEYLRILRVDIGVTVYVCSVETTYFVLQATQWRSPIDPHILGKVVKTKQTSNEVVVKQKTKIANLISP